MSGANDSAVFKDVSWSAKPITAYGNAKISTVQSKWGNGSGYFDGSGYLTSPDGTNWAIGTGDFTLEGWFYPTAFATNHAFGSAFLDTRGSSQGLKGFCLFCNSSGVVTAWDANSVASQSISGSVNPNDWYHIVASRSGTSQKVFVNGVEKIAYSSSYNHTGQQFTIGSAVDFRDTSSNFKYRGYMQDIRFTKRVARYTTDFTPPTEPLPIPEPPNGIVVQSPKVQPFSRLPYGV